MELPKSCVKIAPSILAADYWRLAEQVEAVEAAGADRLHVDVMDGHFVPNLSLGPVIVRAIRPHTGLPLQTHLMVSEPDRFLQPFADAGADSFVVHVENAANLHRTVQQIRELDKRAGVAVNPGTPVDWLEEIAPEVDEVLVMTVNPGFGGQEFIKHSTDKIARVRRLLDRANPTCEIAVDGGIDADTAPLVTGAGARILVAGSAIFRGETAISQAIRELHAAANIATTF